MNEGWIERGACENLGDLDARHIHPAYLTHRNEVGHRSAVDRDPQALTCLDLAEHPTDLVSQLPLWNRSHTVGVAYLLRPCENRR